VTTCADLGFSNDLRALTQSLYDNGDALVRTRLYEMSDASLAATVGVDNGDDLLKQVGIKIWVDGSPWVGNIYSSFGYLDTWATEALGLEPGHQGKPNYTEGQLRDIASAYFPEGWQLACHVHGDLAVDMALNVYEHVLRSAPRENHRLRLEHCGAMTAAQFRRAAELGVTCSLFVGHIYYWGDVLTDGLFGPEYGAHWMRAGSAFESGMPVSFHNDCPVTPEEPLRNIQVAVTRRSRTGTVHGDSERVAMDQAIRAQTIHAAHQLFAEDIVGSLTPGKYADLVVLSTDPRVTDDELPTVLSTYLAGRPTYSADT
jgi:predicted amidohydrolase YtcJ